MARRVSHAVGVAALTPQLRQILCVLAVRAAVVAKFTIFRHGAHTARMLALLGLGHRGLLPECGPLPFLSRVPFET